MELNNNRVITATIDWHRVACIAYFVNLIMYSSTKIVNHWVTLIRWNIWWCMKNLGHGLKKDKKVLVLILVLRKILCIIINITVIISSSSWQAKRCKKCLQTFVQHNLAKYWPIIKILSLARFFSKFPHTLNAWLHYLVKSQIKKNAQNRGL